MCAAAANLEACNIDPISSIVFGVKRDGDWIRAHKRLVANFVLPLRPVITIPFVKVESLIWIIDKCL